MEKLKNLKNYNSHSFGVNKKVVDFDKIYNFTLAGKSVGREVFEFFSKIEKSNFEKIAKLKI